MASQIELKNYFVRINFQNNVLEVCRKSGCNQSWRATSSTGHNSENPGVFNDLTISPEGGMYQKIYAATSKGLFVATDTGGTSWNWSADNHFKREFQNEPVKAVSVFNNKITVTTNKGVFTRDIYANTWHKER